MLFAYTPDLAELRAQAAEQVDLAFGKKLEGLLGPAAGFHALKRSRLGSGGPLVDTQREAIAGRVEEEDAAVAALDERRRELKAKVAAAESPAEIQELTRSI
jgi:hypothetical protein